MYQFIVDNIPEILGNQSTDLLSQWFSLTRGLAKANALQIFVDNEQIDFEEFAVVKFKDRIIFKL
ncbi:MAG: hypothetical protein ACFFCW_48270 [Candidatus Hodarchaeota archaeon]